MSSLAGIVGLSNPFEQHIDNAVEATLASNKAIDIMERFQKDGGDIDELVSIFRDTAPSKLRAVVAKSLKNKDRDPGRSHTVIQKGIQVLRGIATSLPKSAGAKKDKKEEKKFKGNQQNFVEIIAASWAADTKTVKLQKMPGSDELPQLTADEEFDEKWGGIFTAKISTAAREGVGGVVATLAGLAGLALGTIIDETTELLGIETGEEEEEKKKELEDIKDAKKKATNLQGKENTPGELLGGPSLLSPYFLKEPDVDSRGDDLALGGNRSFYGGLSNLVYQEQVSGTLPYWKSLAFDPVSGKFEWGRPRPEGTPEEKKRQEMLGRGLL